MYKIPITTRTIIITVIAVIVFFFFLGRITKNSPDEDSKDRAKDQNARDAVSSKANELGLRV